MKFQTKPEEITLDDILLLPNKSNFPIELQDKKISLKTKISKNITLDIPLVSSPMPAVTETKLAQKIGKAGGIGFIHFFQSFKRQIQQVSQVSSSGVKVAATIADLSKQGVTHVGNLLKAGADLISVESYHAHNKQVIDFIKHLKSKYKKIELSVALLATPEGVRDVIKVGADSVRVGIGGGSHCTTRLVTGVGRPQLSAINHCSKVAKRYKVPLISDTGIKYAGDIAKAIAFGADAVMIGGLFAGTNEAPGSIIRKGSKKYKKTWGMCTQTAINQTSHDHNNGNDLRSIINSVSTLIRSSVLQQKPIFEEGVEGLVKYQGNLDTVLNQLVSGLKRSMWYQGASTISQLKQKARAVKISSATHLENAPRL